MQSSSCSARLFRRISCRLLAVALLGSASASHAAIWLCIDPESGAKTYTSNPRGAGKCKRTDIPGSSGGAASSISSEPRATTRTAARTPSNPAPVSAETRARESDRKQILTDELASENRRLAELQREFNVGAPIRRPDETDEARYQERKTRLSAEIERSKSNVRALERELGRP